MKDDCLESYAYFTSSILRFLLAAQCTLECHPEFAALARLISP